MLIFSAEKEHQSPCQDSMKASIKEPRLLNGFANDWCTGQVTLECCNKSWRPVYPIDIKPFIDQYRRDGKTGPAPQIDHAAAPR